jgi:hypothetical protein
MEGATWPGWLQQENIFEVELMKLSIHSDKAVSAMKNI